MNNGKKFRIHIPGGNITPIDLSSIVLTANSLGVDFIEPGSRQEILFDIPISSINTGEHNYKLKSIPFTFDNAETISNNIVSSHPVVDIYSKSSWVSEGTYLDIFSDFKNPVPVKINITDPEQTMFPWWGGQLNFVASEKPGLWNLIWEDKEKNLKVFPEPIYTKFIYSASMDLSQAILSGRNTAGMNAGIEFKQFLKTQNPEKWMQSKFPITEGLHRYGDKFWLGLFSRNNNFPISLLESLCRISLQTQSVKFGITPWKTFLFRGIHEEDIPKWLGILEKYKWNTRHSGLELSWFVTDTDDSAGFLKKKILKKLDALNLFPPGFSVGIYSEEESQLTHIGIKRKYFFPNWKYLGSQYAIYLLKTPWDINSKKIPIATVARSTKAVEIISDMITGNSIFNESEEELLTEVSSKTNSDTYQCPNCWTTYNPQAGDTEQNVPPNTKWADVADTYKCPVCETDKVDFKVKP